jgi:hypothetical protein
MTSTDASDSVAGAPRWVLPNQGKALFPASGLTKRSGLNKFP